MKKFLTLALVTLMVAGMSLSASAFAPVGNVSVPYATPKVDGVINADEYLTEGRVVIDQSNAIAGGWLGEVPAANSIELFCLHLLLL